MERAAPGLRRIAVMAAFALSCFGLLLFLWVAFGGTVPFGAQGYRFHVHFPEATSLAEQADVRISGVPVGKVVKLSPAADGLTDATIQMRSRYAPVPDDTRAMLRQKTLLGETYVELTPGTPGRAHQLREGGRLAQGRVAPAVQLDEIYRSFDERTRQAFQAWMASGAAALRGRGQDVNDALGNLGPFSEDTSRILTLLDSQSAAVRRLVSDGGTALGALTARDAELRSLIQSSDRVLAVTARRNADLAELMRQLPPFEDQTVSTLERLDTFATNADPLVEQLRPAARRLSPALVDLRALSPDLRGLFVDLNPLVDASRRGLPALSGFLRSLRPLLDQADPFLRNLVPAVDFLGTYPDEIRAFFANTVAATEATNIPFGSSHQVHYLRTSNPINAENLAQYPRRLGSNRPNAYPVPDAFRNAGDLPVFEDRQCRRTLLTPPSGDPLSDLVGKLLSTAGSVLPAHSCVRQGRNAGSSTDYPQVAARPAGR